MNGLTSLILFPKEILLLFTYVTQEKPQTATLSVQSFPFMPSIFEY